jgi:hypothetical protein
MVTFNLMQIWCGKHNHDKHFPGYSIAERLQTENHGIYETDEENWTAFGIDDPWEGRVGGAGCGQLPAFVGVG